MGAVHRFRATEVGYRWEGVALETYADEAGAGGTRQVLIGAREGAEHYAVRYFEIPPGGTSALERHVHDHAVVVLRGRGSVRLGEYVHAIGFGDALYIGSHEVHQLTNPGPEPLGFLCVVAPAMRAISQER